MATVRIGEKDLDVKTATLGFLKKQLMPARKLLEAATEEGTPDAMAAVFLCYVGHNEGVTLDWLLDNLPADPGEVMRAVIVASGQKLREVAAGEAARP